MPLDHLRLNPEKSSVIYKTKELFKKIGMEPLLYFPRKIFRVIKKNDIRKLYKNNSENIKQVIDLCADQRSKDVVKTQLDFIKNYDYSGETEYIKKIGLFEKYSEMIDKDEYFPRGIISLSENECFVDGGGFDGDTVEAFVKESKGNFNHIFTFEPDRNNFPKLLNRIDSLKLESSKINSYQKGLYSENKKIGFTERGIGSYVTENKDNLNYIEVVTLDSFLDQNAKDKISFIKLDIEGAEVEALKGMKDIIAKNKPKMAVCVYHTPEHFWEVPLYLKTLNPEYKIYFRQHALSRLETVCYAV